MTVLILLSLVFQHPLVSADVASDCCEHTCCASGIPTEDDCCEDGSCSCDCCLAPVSAELLSHQDLVLTLSQYSSFEKPGDFDSITQTPRSPPPDSEFI